MLHMGLEIIERANAEQSEAPGCTHAESLKVLTPRLLHSVGLTWKF